MATITGPNVQVPQGSQFVDASGALTQEAATFLRAIGSIAFYQTRSGPTASRPTSSAYRWTGMNYFDTTLGLPVYLKTASSNAWVKGDGTAA